MRTTLNIDDDLLEKAAKLTGIEETPTLIRLGLEALIAKEAALRLAQLGVSEKQLKLPTRKAMTIKDPDLAKVGVALERAAAKARQLGFDTNTPVYIFRDGKIVDIVKEYRGKESTKKTKAKTARKKATTRRGKVQSKSAG